MSDYYARDGERITMDEWMALFETAKASAQNLVNYRHVGRDMEVMDSLRREHGVSTVWLGLDHGWGDGPPLIFETMIFCHGHKCSLDEEQWRYSTEVQAVEGHAAAVALVQSAASGGRET